jgi:hypothetical protein
MTVHRMKQHLVWLQEIGLIDQLELSPGRIDLSIKLPDPAPYTEEAEE